MYEYVSGEKVAAAKDLSMGMLRELKGRLKENGLNAKIDLIGSASRRNMVTRKGDGPFDLDFNLRFADAGRGLKGLKDLIRSALDVIAAAKGFSHGQDSTSVITYKRKADGAEDFTLDVGIIIVKDGRVFRLINKKAQAA